MKRNILLCVATIVVLLFCIIGGSCSPKPNNSNSSSTPETPIKDVTFYMVETLELQEYTQKEISFELLGADETEIVWTSENNDIATVKNGIVTGIKEGETNVKAVVGKVEANCLVKVTKNYSYPRILLSQTDVMPRVGGEVEVTASIRFNGETVDFSEFEWISDNSAVAIAQNGIIKGISEGTANITVKVVYGGVRLEETIIVTVVKEPTKA